MTRGIAYFSGVALGLAALLACAAADCGFQPDCRPGESYRLAIPCEGKCSSYVECSDGAAVEKKCGKYFFTTKSFDPVRLECVRDSVDCDWWRKVVTTTAAPATSTPATTSTLAPETTPSTSTTESAPSTSTEASTPAAADTTTEASSTTPAPSSTLPPPPPTAPAESAAAPLAAAPLAAAWPALLAAAAALML